jgi:hypothetical protein
MDTDDLSKEAYYAILVEAKRFTHDLTLHYGVLSEDCDDEEEYLSKAEELTKDILSCDDVDLDDLFFDDPPQRKALDKALNRILSNIDAVRRIPLNKRTIQW